MQAERLNQWASFKQEVTAIRRAQVATSAAPMEIGAFGGGGGKNTGRGGNSENRKCFNCGKVGHLSKDCRQKKDGGGGGAASSNRRKDRKDSGKGGKGGKGGSS